MPILITLVSYGEVGTSVIHFLLTQAHTDAKFKLRATRTDNIDELSCPSFLLYVAVPHLATLLIQSDLARTNPARLPDLSEADNLRLKSSEAAIHVHADDDDVLSQVRADARKWFKKHDELNRKVRKFQLYCYGKIALFSRLA